MRCFDSGEGYVAGDIPGVEAKGVRREHGNAGVLRDRETSGMCVLFFAAAYMVRTTVFAMLLVSRKMISPGYHSGGCGTLDV